jgi:hypothetical protein
MVGSAVHFSEQSFHHHRRPFDDRKREVVTLRASARAPELTCGARHRGGMLAGLSGTGPKSTKRISIKSQSMGDIMIRAPVSCVTASTTGATSAKLATMSRQPFESGS